MSRGKPPRTFYKMALYLDPVSANSGALRVIPGSHRGDLEPHCPAPLGAKIPAKRVVKFRVSKKAKDAILGVKK